MNEQTETIEAIQRASRLERMTCRRRADDRSARARSRRRTAMSELWRRGVTVLSANGAATPSFVYAIGRVEARFPNLAAEKEFAQATGRTDTAGKTDQADLPRRSVQAREPLPRAPTVLGADHPGAGNLPAGAARSGGHRSAGGSHPSGAEPQ